MYMSLNIEPGEEREVYFIEERETDEESYLCLCMGIIIVIIVTILIIKLNLSN